MSQRSLVPVIAGTSLLGGIVFWFSRPTNKTPEESRRARADAKKSEGLSGAGVGQNATTGGHETSQPGSGIASAQDDRDKTGTTARKDQLPSGGVGGGVGAGGSNVRAIEKSAKKSSGSSSDTTISSVLGGVFGTGGPSAGTGTKPESKDTKVASNYAGTPTKRNADFHDQHQPRVEKTGNRNAESNRNPNEESGGGK